MPCKIMKKNCGSGTSNKIKTRLVCILEVSESTRMRMGNSIPHHHEDHLAVKGNNSLQHYNLVHKFILMPQALKIPAAKAAVDKEWEKLEKISARNLTIRTCLRREVPIVRTPHLTRPFFTVNYMHTHGSSLGPHSFHHIYVSCVIWCVFLIVLSSTTPLSSLSSPSSLLSPCPSFCPSTSSSRTWRTSTLRTLAKEHLCTLAEYDPLTSYEPNDYHITEATEPYTQESSVENGSPNDFEYDDVTIGKALSSPPFTQEREDAASRRRADHSEEEGLSSVSHDRTGRPVVEPLDSKNFKCSRNSEPQLRKWANQDSSGTTKKADSRWLSGRDSKTRIPGRLWQKKYSKVEWSYRVSKRRNKSCTCKRRTTSTRSTTSSWTIIGNKIEIFVKLMRKVLMRWKDWSDFKGLHSIEFQGEDWSKIETLYLNSQARFRNYRMKLIAWMIREILKMLNQYAVDNPTLPVNPAFFQSFPDPGGLLSRSLGMPSRNNGPPSILGHAWSIGKRLCKSNGVFFSTLSAGVKSMDLYCFRTHITTYDECKPNTSSGSEMPVRIVSQKFSHPWWGWIFKELRSRPTTTADFGSSFWQIPYASYVCVLEDKIQDWGMYLLTSSNGSYAVRQRSGDGWISGWF